MNVIKIKIALFWCAQSQDQDLLMRFCWDWGRDTGEGKERVKWWALVVGLK